MIRHLRPNGTGSLSFYLTAAHPCAYLQDQQARTLFLDPATPLGEGLYQTLLARGFRRSGCYLYRPACRNCQGCISVRLPVADFMPNRSQRRAWQRNATDMAIAIGPARFDPAHFALYQRYLAARHAGGEMAENATETSYRRFLIEPWGGTTCLIELWLGGHLAGVAVTDIVQQGLSAVYTFFDPNLAARSLGTFAILTQIQITQRLKRPFLYLGYWIADSPKMAYKAHFRPLEAWDGQHWQRFMSHQPITLTGAGPCP
ncbi:arginyltransferase [Caldichromatium japonicum]|uniref:Aspartate/glutamate leucyltransferase n=1 Tax=Caldichromatium japonicum TaxID=2699430 RepID=A0A6G7VF50_9GAMM|nr:arginyltransferase [Caldichromatium japonicum]QIK38496.1 arginyltransferase [Caldichromatium japonicum]